MAAKWLGRNGLPDRPTMAMVRACLSIRSRSNAVVAKALRFTDELELTAPVKVSRLVILCPSMRHVPSAGHMQGVRVLSRRARAAPGRDPRAGRRYPPGPPRAGSSRAAHRRFAG